MSDVTPLFVEDAQQALAMLLTDTTFDTVETDIAFKYYISQ